MGVVAGLLSAMVAALVTEVYCHRCLAHRAVRVRPKVASALDTYFKVVVGTNPGTWAAVHRLHHRHADTALDPHSPRLRPPITVLAGSALLFATARRRLPPDTEPGRGTAHLAVRILLVGSFAALFGLVQALVMLGLHLVCYLGVMGAVNAVGHLYGTKPHPGVAGYDLAWLAIPLLGHGYHNSHHAHPTAARTGPLDPIWPLLRLLAALRAIEFVGQDHPRPAPACCAASEGLLLSPGR